MWNIIRWSYGSRERHIAPLPTYRSLPLDAALRSLFILLLVVYNDYSVITYNFKCHFLEILKRVQKIRQKQNDSFKTVSVTVVYSCTQCYRSFFNYENRFLLQIKTSYSIFLLYLLFSLLLFCSMLRGPPKKINHVCDWS